MDGREAENRDGGGWVGLGEGGGGGASSRGRISAKRNGTKGTTLRLLNCARTCALLFLFSFIDFIRLCTLHFPFSFPSTSTYMHSLHPFSTPPRAKIARFWLLTFLLPSSPTIFSFSPIPRIRIFRLSGALSFPKQKVTRERMSTRETLSNRGLSPP